MFNYEYRSTTSAGRVCLELSLKPFGYEKTPEGFEKVARQLFTQWMPLLKYATGCSVLFWTSDGSEILDYTGNLDDSFEWCQYIGIGNWDRTIDPEKDPDSKSLHHFPINYIENPPKMTYGDLKEIISAMKRVGREVTGFEIEVGETFDPGPEFAYSTFKYERHTEISVGNIMGCKMWMHCASRLHADTRRYAAYPDGIPEGTHIGEFLGRQFMAMKEQLGFDYLWLSNGFGFSLSSWNWTGELFDGKEFNFSGAAKVRESIAEFWKYFSAEIGDMRIETRGSNLSTGMDIAAHGCPIDDIYKQNIVAPPNSPWAPLNYRFGLELAGFMSHIAELPEKGFNLRYYIHDPWWLNSPWFDRYDRSPHDIYLPIGIARLDENCKVTKPFGLSFLSADDSFGRLPNRCPNEVTPHLLTAFDDYPDSAGLVTWIYPFDAYCKIGLCEGKLERVFMDDWFMESAVDMGLPVNTVISDRNFIKADKKKLLSTILITPVPEAGSELENALFAALSLGAKIILFGSVRYASERMKKAIGIEIGSDIDGKLDFSTSLKLDTAEVGEYSKVLMHVPLLSNGGICETACCGAEVIAEVAKDGEKRAYAVIGKEPGLIWIRGSFPHDAASRGALPNKLRPSQYFPPAVLTRAVMQHFGYPMTFECYDIDDNLPIVQFVKCRNAVYYNLFAKDASVKLRYTTPDGAPAFDNSEFIIEDDFGTYTLSRWIHTDCRVFIKQKKRSKIMIKKDCVHTHIDVDYRYTITGLYDAEVTMYPSEGGIAWIHDGRDWKLHNGPTVEAVFDPDRGCYVAKNVSGNISVMIQDKENIGDYKKLEFLRKP
jgi:hypothetical protein